jgi:TPR repeat protein
VPQDLSETVRWFRKAAEQGNAAAQHNLGVAYAEGKGVPCDVAEAVTWFHKAADQGDGAAQFNLGVAYSEGEGVPQDNVFAYMWWNLSAASGIEHAAVTKELVAKQMTKEEIAEARRKSREWFDAHR